MGEKFSSGPVVLAGRLPAPPQTLHGKPANMYTFGVEIDLTFDAAITKVMESLQAEKLGVVSDVNVSAILKNKLGEDIGGYRILGACAPSLAKRVIDAKPDAGVLLPCTATLPACRMYSAFCQTTSGTSSRKAGSVR